MSHHATRSNSRVRRPDRSNRIRRHLGTLSALLVGIVLFGHLLVAAHAGSHVAQPSVDGISESCAVCTVGKGSTGVLAAIVRIRLQADIWEAEFVRPRALPVLSLYSANAARAPPSIDPTFDGV